MDRPQKRVFLIVLDSVGIGRAPDAAQFGDEGSNTLASAATSASFIAPHLASSGLFNIPGIVEDIEDLRAAVVPGAERFEVSKDLANPSGAFGRCISQSKGKDTTIGHWEIAGIISDRPLPVYPDGFPEDVIRLFSEEIGRGVLCNRPYSGTDVIRDFGPEHIKTGDLIVYTSADSVFQIAAHEDVVPIEELYRCCEVARRILQGENGVGRVIARPFEGSFPDYSRTANRHDYSIPPPRRTMLDDLSESGRAVIGIGKIGDIYSGQGLTESVRTMSNQDGISKTIETMHKSFSGLCFTNLVDFDSKHGHRNDVDGYADAISQFDRRLPELLEAMQPDDLLMITADHGCDPLSPSTDHSRETVPILVLGDMVRVGTDIGVRNTFADIAATVLAYFGFETENISHIDGTSFLDKILTDINLEAKNNANDFYR